MFVDNDMAGRHRSRNKSIQIIRTATIPAKDCKRESTIMFHDSKERGSKVRFPLPHRILRPSSKQNRPVFAAMRPNTHFQ